MDAVTRRSGESYAAFIERIAATSPLAVAVKLNDLADNAARCGELPEPAASGLALRYAKAIARLTNASQP